MSHTIISFFSIVMLLLIKSFRTAKLRFGFVNNVENPDIRLKNRCLHYRQRLRSQNDRRGRPLSAIKSGNEYSSWKERPAWVKISSILISPRDALNL